MRGLKQYGFAGGLVYRPYVANPPILDSSEPPAQFGDGDVWKFLTAAFGNTLPSPNDNNSDGYLYVVFMPPGVSPTNGAGGEHTAGNWGGKMVHFAWVANGSSDRMTSLFSHELVAAGRGPARNTS